MSDIKKALIWITGIFKKHQIPFQISRGLAARVYGATRPLEDLDIDIPEDKFNVIKNGISDFIIYGPENFKDNKWNLLLMTLDYQGQLIDLSGAYNTKIFNEKMGIWQDLSEDLSLATVQNVFGLQLPVIPKNKLIAYKKVLSRKEDIMDVNEIEKTHY